MASPWAALVGTLSLLLVPPAPAAVAPADSDRGVRLSFSVTLIAGEATANASIRVQQASSRLRQVEFRGRALRNVQGDGTFRRQGDRLWWQPPASGGELRYRVTIDHKRPSQRGMAYDAVVTRRWALFRGEDVFPVRGWKRQRSANVRSDLLVRVPGRWSVITPYLPDAGGLVPVRNPGKRLARPIGWIIAGDIGTRRDVVEGLEVTVSAPRGVRMERIAMLGLLRWTLPTLRPLLAGMPRYISIVAADDPMWLGALSAPNSVFVNAGRPLVSENGTSTIVHELVHVMLSEMDTPADQDWIDEGLAEYLALRAMERSGTISAQRYAKTIADFRAWGRQVPSLRTRHSTGAVSARAVAVMHDLDAEISAATRQRRSLLDVVVALRSGDSPVDLAVLRKAAAAIIGRPSRALSAANVPGFD
jgi:hypothetical protein